MKEKNYTPISCDFYDELEAMATNKTVAHIHYFNTGGQKKCAEAAILNFKIKDHVEYMILSNDHYIRLDQVISVNDLFLADAKYC